MIKQLINDLFGSFKFFHIIPIIAFAIIITIIYINWPRLNPKIVIENDSVIRLSIDQPVKKVSLQFTRNIQVHSYLIMQKNSVENKRQVLKKGNIGQILPKIEIDISKVHLIDEQKVFIDIKTARRNISISNAEINNTRIILNQFAANNILNENKRVKNVNIIREEISIFLLRINEKVGNYILTFLTVLLCPITFFVLYKFFMFIFTSRFRKYILKSIKNKEKADISKIRNNYGGKYIVEGQVFTYLSVIGPAVGFLLTVSSLIAGLHPSLFSPDKIGYFFQAIQLAMVSTFLGLFIRIEALSVLAINRNLLGKFEAFVNEYENENKSNNTNTI